jgi:CheY-like chemotaxis protein
LTSALSKPPLGQGEPPPPSSRTRVVERKKILIVDDSYTARALLRSMLSGLPCDMITAGDGVEAVERALAERPNLILMDVEMPRMDGLTACRRLRLENVTRNTPILLVTTRGRPQQLRTGFECGCSGYVTKPIDSTELLTKVKNYLGP